MKKCSRGKIFNKKTKRCNKLKKKSYFKKGSRLSDRERRYCRCIIKVRSQGIRSPYAICTNSVYNRQGTVRNKRVSCTKNINFKNLSLKELRNQAVKSNINIKTPNNKYYPRSILIRKLKSKYA